MFSFTYIKLAIYAAVFAAGAYTSWYVMDGRLSKKELEYEQERTVAALRTAEAEKQARETESAWRSDVAAKQAEYERSIALRDSRINNLNSTNNKLSERIASLSRTGGAAEDSPSAASHLRNRVEALGLLVAELDSFAGKVASEADTLREELGLCRDYAGVISDNYSR